MTEQQESSNDPSTGTPEPAPTYMPPATPPTEASELEPGRGAPLVAGPPRSVSQPIDAGKVNTVFGIGGVLGILALVVVVILVGLLLISLLTHR